MTHLTPEEKKLATECWYEDIEHKGRPYKFWENVVIDNPDKTYKQLTEMMA